MRNFTGKFRSPLNNQEWLAFDFPATSANSAQVMIRWEKVAVPFTVEIPNVEALMLRNVEQAIAANPTDWKIALDTAAQFRNAKKWDMAIAWADKSIKVKETYNNLAFKTQMLASAGRKDEALALAEKALAQGKTDKADTKNFEKWLADFKAGKM